MRSRRGGIDGVVKGHRAAGQRGVRTQRHRVTVSLRAATTTNHAGGDRTAVDLRTACRTGAQGRQTGGAYRRVKLRHARRVGYQCRLASIRSIHRALEP